MKKQHPLEVALAYCAATVMILAFVVFFVGAMAILWLKDRWAAVRGWVRWPRG